MNLEVSEAGEQFQFDEDNDLADIEIARQNHNYQLSSEQGIVTTYDAEFIAMQDEYAEYETISQQKSMFNIKK
jgi:hypothetical protein